MMRDRNRRQHSRMEPADHWTVQNPDGVYLGAQHQLASDIRLVDVSADGIGIQTVEPLAKDAVISFDLCFSHTFHRVVARVLWVRKIGKSWRSGLQVLQIPEELMEEIEEYLTVDHAKPLN